ncbi:unnamed protein product [Ectocarpus fasciculatus]
MPSPPLLPPPPALRGQAAARPPRQELTASLPRGSSESRPPAAKPAATRDTALSPRGGLRKTRQRAGGTAPARPRSKQAATRLRRRRFLSGSCTCFAGLFGSRWWTGTGGRLCWDLWRGCR